jgi:hypothetical protein
MPPSQQPSSPHSTGVRQTLTLESARNQHGSTKPAQTSTEKPLRRFIPGTDAVGTAEEVAATLEQQIGA